MKKHDEKSAPTTVVETDVGAREGLSSRRGSSAVPLDAPLANKLDAVPEGADRELLAARLRLIEANLLGRLDPEAAPDEAEPASADPAVVDVEKSKAIAAQLRRKPQA